MFNVIYVKKEDLFVSKKDLNPLELDEVMNEIDEDVLLDTFLKYMVDADNRKYVWIEHSIKENLFSIVETNGFKSFACHAGIEICETLEEYKENN